MNRGLEYLALCALACAAAYAGAGQLIMMVGNSLNDSAALIAEAGR